MLRIWVAGALALISPEVHGGRGGAVPSAAPFHGSVLIVAQGASAAAAMRSRRIPFVWRGEGAIASTPDGALTVRLARTDRAGGAAELEASAEWNQPAWAHRVGVEITLPGDRARLFGRDLRSLETHQATLDRFDPKWVTALAGRTPSATVMIDDSVDDVRVRVEPRGVTLTIDLDSAAARPFVHDQRCAKRWREPNGELAVPARFHPRGDRARARVELRPGLVLPLLKAHFPDGRSAAFVLTDHADQSSARTLEALARRLLAHHLAITKALFAHGGDRPQLDTRAVERLADALAEAGSEIVPHSATPRPDDRATTLAALERFARWHARTWIDHQPETNCEAFGDLGWRSSGRYGIADLLAAHHYQYVWENRDAKPGELNLLSPRHPDRPAPTVWPLGRLEPGGPDSLWMFRTMWAFVGARRFYALYAPAELDRLEQERGLHIAHTYLETYHAKGTRFGARNLMVPADRRGAAGGPGPVALDARFEALLGALERRQERGTLWVATLGALADRLRATAEVTLRLAEDGGIRLHSPRALPGATFVVPMAGVEVQIAGHAPRGVRRSREETLFWDDLPEGDTSVRLTRNGAPLPF